MKSSNTPLFLVYLGVAENGKFYNRSVFGCLDLLSNAGGFLKSIGAIIQIIVVIACTVKVKAKLISIILRK